ncbi:histidine kinase dimerization/phospho-acceptor domain-containing protein [Lysinibacillus sp. NPDC096418]|uniref:sensor histidine kinase n=1 Tax=Lysinibacillus sp. NPDC096418 TaxID=3364138 RepID=UPI003815A869
MKKWKSLLALICLIWFIFGVFLFANIGYKYIGKSYFDTDDFGFNLEQFEEELGPYVLNVPKADELKKKLTVSQEEIEEHRNRYGSFGNQVENIRQQYEAQIQEAIANKADELKAKLEAERDDKIKDITKNFEDDEYVKTKVMKEKEAVIDEYIAAARREAKNFKKSFNYFSYELVNTENGKKYVSGDVSEDLAYKVEYTAQKPLRTWNISEGLNGISHQAYVYINTDREFTDEHTYVDEDRGMFTDSIKTEEVATSPYEENPTIAQEYTYTGTIAITKSSFLSMGNEEDYNKFKRNQYVYSFIWLTSLVAAFIAWRWRKSIITISIWGDFEAKLKKLRFDWQVTSVFLTGIVYWLSFYLLFEPIEYQYHSNYVEFIAQFLTSMVVMSILGIAFFIQAIWLYRRINTLDELGRNLRESYLWHLGDSIADLFLNRSIALHSIVVVAAAFFGGGSFVASMVNGGFPVLVFGVCGIVGVPAFVVFLSRMGYLNRIMKDTEDMAEGRLNRDVKVKGKSPLAKHAENLNHLREGVRTSMHEQAKSERLKTELITNVSHDLRTPLTSIITYTDLLKKPDLTEEERKQYIHILDKKSDRLKVLIEDLFEVSKMASGNIELHRSRVDLTQLVQQAVGEHEEDLAKQRLDLRMTMPPESIYAYVDGQKWWRLIDNLIVNVLKYALEGTRVYVTLKRHANGEAEFTVKNVAKYEISENADELFERFKRADASRHTEGSGLGLAIAQSIVDLHGARMSIEVDGDLFKVIVTIPTV